MLLRRRGQTLKGEALFLYSFLCIVFFCSSVTRKSYSWHLSGYLTKSAVSKIIDYPDTKSIIHVKRAERKLFYKTWILHSRGFQGFLLWGVTSEHHCLIHPPIETCHLRFLTLPSTCGKKTISPFDSHYGPVHCRCVVECYSLLANALANCPPFPLILLSESLKKLGLQCMDAELFTEESQP